MFCERMICSATARRLTVVSLAVAAAPPVAGTGTQQSEYGGIVDPLG